MLTIGTAFLISVSNLEAQNVGSSLDGFDPNANGIVRAIAVQADGKILIAGDFTMIGGQARNRIARLHHDGSLDTGFDPNADGIVRAIAIQVDGKIVVGGDFINIGGQARNRIARLETDGLLDTSFDPNANGVVHAVAIQADGKILAGGDFSNIGGQPRNRMGRLETTGLADLGFNPDANGIVRTILVEPGGGVMFGGDFTAVGGTARNRIASVFSNGSLATTFDPSADGSVHSLARQVDGKLLVGGEFTMIGAVARNRLARFHADGSLDAAYDPDADGSVFVLAVQSDGKVLAGGAFANIGGAARNRIARLEWDGTAEVNFDPNANSEVRSLAVQSDQKVVIGGQFTNIGSRARNNIVRILTNGLVETHFNPVANSGVRSFAIQPDGKIVVSGLFGIIGGQFRNGIARLHADDTLDVGFDASANGGVEILALQEDGKILMGGDFTQVDGQSRGGIARLNSDGSLDTGFNPGANAGVRALVVQPDGKILVGGIFTNVAGQTRNRIARLNPDGSLDTTFDPNANGVVVTLALREDGKILAGGEFTTVSGQTRNGIAAINSDGSLDTGFNPDANEDVYALALQADGKILVGGLFTEMGGQPRNRIARLEADGTLDGAFDPNADQTVFELAVQANQKILVGGAFTSIGGGSPSKVARLHPDGTLDTGFSPNANANGLVFALALQADGKILVGGDFSSIGGQPRSRLARLTNGSAIQEIKTGNIETALTWERGGTSPPTGRVKFEMSIDEGDTWSILGAGARIGTTENWQLTDLALPRTQNILIRATGIQQARGIDAGSSIFQSPRAFFLPPTVIINEIDAYTQAGDTREFIELYDGGIGSMTLDDFVVVLFDGASDTSYAAFDLDSQTTDANGYFVLGNSGVSNVDQIIFAGSLQNGADAVAVFRGASGDFPNGTAVTTTNLLDAVVYDRGQADDSGLLVLLNAGQSQVDESSNGINPAGHSLQRIANGSGGPRNTNTYLALAPTPGEANSFAPPPGVPDLAAASDLGSSNSDDLTSDDMPTFTCTARAGSRIVLSSDLDGTIGFGVTDENGNWTATASVALSEGVHQITARADGSAPGAPLAITIDTTPPPVPTGLDLTNGSDSGSLGDDLTNDNTPDIAGDGPSGHKINLYAEGNPVGSGTASSLWTITSSILNDGLHQVTARSEDDAGNESVDSLALPITIDTMVPTVTINQAGAQADPTSGTPVNFDVVFSEPVIGFESGDVSLSGSAGPSSPAVGGGPSNFTVSANGVTGEGLVIAAIGGSVATDAAGNGNSAGTSSDNQVVIDSHGGTTGTATAVDVSTGNGVAPGWLEAGDTDVFSFVLAGPVHVQIETTGAVDTLGQLRDGEGNPLNDPDADDDSGADENFRISLPLTAGMYFVEVTGKGGNPSGAYQLEITIGVAALFQPDHHVGKSAGAAAGNDVYNTSAGQILSLLSKKARTVRGVIVIENDGDLADDFTVTGTRGNSIFKVTYSTAAGNVTAGIIAGTHPTGIKNPGDSPELITVTVKPNKRKIQRIVRRKGVRRVTYRRKRITLNIQSVSEGDPAKQDAGFIKVRTR